MTNLQAIIIGAAIVLAALAIGGIYEPMGASSLLNRFTGDVVICYSGGICR